MTTIKNLSQNWWDSLLLKSKVDFIRQYVNGISPTTALIGREIENIFYQEVIVKWWDAKNYENEKTPLWDSLSFNARTNNSFEINLKYLYLKEHTKEEQELHTCKHCGVETTQPDSECYKAPKEEVNVWDKEMLLNMQYYMEYCQENGYITPKDWLNNYKHF